MNTTDIAAVGSLGGLATLGLGFLYWLRSRLSSGHIVIILRSKSGGELEDRAAELKAQLDAKTVELEIATALNKELAEKHDKLQSEYIAELRGTPS